MDRFDVDFDVAFRAQRNVTHRARKSLFRSHGWLAIQRMTDELFSFSCSSCLLFKGRLILSMLL